MTTVTTTTTTTYGGAGDARFNFSDSDRAQTEAERMVLRLFRDNGNKAGVASTLSPEFTNSLASLGISEPTRNGFTQRQAYAASVVRDALKSLQSQGLPVNTETLESIANNPNAPADLRAAVQFTLSSGAWHQIEMLDTGGGRADGKSSIDNFDKAASSWGY